MSLCVSVSLSVCVCVCVCVCVLCVCLSVCVSSCPARRRALSVIPCRKLGCQQQKSAGASETEQHNKLQKSRQMTMPEFHCRDAHGRGFRRRMLWLHPDRLLHRPRRSLLPPVSLVLHQGRLLKLGRNGVVGVFSPGIIIIIKAGCSL